MVEVPIGKVKGSDGITPHIGENGNWFIENEDTGIRAGNKETIIVNITASVPDRKQSAYSIGSADKTLEEIKTANAEGKSLLVNYNNAALLPFISVTGTAARFGLTFTDSEKSENWLVEIKSDEVRVYRHYLIYKNEYIEPYINMLAVGDSLWAGPSGKAFLQSLGTNCVIKAVNGAQLANTTNLTSGGTQRKDIPQQLIDYAAAPTFVPDVILADGGVNDYRFQQSLGTLSAEPVIKPTYADKSTVIVKTSAERAAELDRSTVLGALEYLFYQMYLLYPAASKFFVLPHKMYGEKDGNWFYYPEFNNKNSWNVQTLHDKVEEACKMYGVKLIDIFGEGTLNTSFECFRNGIYVEADDGIHPTVLGYEVFYKPYLKEALSLASKK